jgi:surface antigen
LTLSLPKPHSEPSRRGLQILSQLKALAACAMMCQALAACAFAGPPGASDWEATGSIAPVATRKPPALPVALDDEDRRRALDALALALDPQGNGATVQWDNPVSKARGSVTPRGYAYPANNLICRDFNAQFTTSQGPETARGAACRDKYAQWTLAELRPSK